MSVLIYLFLNPITST